MLAKMKHEIEKWIYQPCPAHTAAMRLFCFHYAGGSAQIYRKWGTALASIAEIRAIQLPGRGSRLGEVPYEAIQNLINDLYPVIAGQLDKPFAFFGHSLGGIIAFELARKLKQEGVRQPSALIVASRVAPGTERPASLLTVLSDDAFLKGLNDRYGPAVGSSLMDDPEIRAIFMPSLRADMRLFETYEYSGEDRFTFPIFALRGKEDLGIKIEAVDEWRKFTVEEFTCREFEGGHFFWQDNEGELLQFINPTLMQISKT
jgi:medium-chain acyl-[acyl-carrier-protein] hydrolase